MLSKSFLSVEINATVSPKRAADALRLADFDCICLRQHKWLAVSFPTSREVLKIPFCHASRQFVSTAASIYTLGGKFQMCKCLENDGILQNNCLYRFVPAFPPC